MVSNGCVDLAVQRQAVQGLGGVLKYAGLVIKARDRTTERAAPMALLKDQPVGSLQRSERCSNRCVDVIRSGNS